MHRFPVALAVAIVLAAPTAAHAQCKLSADEKELAAYTLTMPALKKMGAALNAASEAMARDPRYQPLMKLGNDISAREKELEKLQAKDDLTQAEQIAL